MRLNKKTLACMTLSLMLSLSAAEAYAADTTTAAQSQTAETAAVPQIKVKARTVVYKKTLKLKIKKATDYKVADTKIAKVSKKGVVTGLKAGKTKVSYKKGGKEYYFVLTVKKAASKITLKKKTLTVEAGKTVSIKASAKVGLTYTVKNSKVATVTAKGQVKGLSVGTTTVTITGKSGTNYKAPKSKKVKIKVTKGTAKINVPTKSITTFVGVKENIKASCEVPMKYQVLGGTAVQVDATGKLTAVATGTSTIQITGSGTSSYNSAVPLSVKVTVKDSPVDTKIPEPDEDYAMKVYEGNKTIDSWMAVCQTIAKTIVNDGDWVYYEKGNDNSFADARRRVKSGVRNASCSVYVSYCMQQFGTLPVGNRIYSGKTTTTQNVHYIGSAAKQALTASYINKYYNVIDVDKKTVSELDAAGQLKKGDILCYNYHMNIYAGKDETGTRTWYDFGRAGTVNGVAEDSGPYNRVLRVDNMNNSYVYRIYRLKSVS